MSLEWKSVAFNDSVEASDINDAEQLYSDCFLSYFYFFSHNLSHPQIPQVNINVACICIFNIFIAFFFLLDFLFFLALNCFVNSTESFDQKSLLNWSKLRLKQQSYLFFKKKKKREVCFSGLFYCQWTDMKPVQRHREGKSHLQPLQESCIHLLWPLCCPAAQTAVILICSAQVCRRKLMSWFFTVRKQKWAKSRFLLMRGGGQGIMLGTRSIYSKKTENHNCRWSYFSM